LGQESFSSNNKNLQNESHNNNFDIWQTEEVARTTPTMENMNSSQQQIKQESPTITKATRSYSEEGSASCTPHSSFSEQWVCDSCGSTTFDYERKGCGCEHEERSLRFVKSM
jgi:hypothetical protein